MQTVAIGVHVHAEPARLQATLAAIEAHTPAGFELMLLPDGPDPPTRAALASLGRIVQFGTDTPLGAAACFNRLAQASKAETVVLLESGTIVAPGWLEKLLSALDADPRHGLASPSTNQAWNQLAAFPNCRGDDADIAHTAAEAERRFGGTWRSLAPLWDVGDFCLAVRRAVVDAVGPADEAYGQGPCWEMDYAIRAVRAGFFAVWVQGAYVFRHPFTERRQREEARLHEASRRRYQDKFCGLKLSGARGGYAQHCRGEVCKHFAPPAVAQSMTAIVSRSPLASCIMPTANRRRFVPDAIALFLAQDYVAKELIIVDDGEDPVGDLVPSHPALRYVRAPRHSSLGVKRNAACQAAQGDVILHWDDDDWYAPHRIRAQVEALRTSGAALCGIDRVLFFDPRTPAAWEYVYSIDGAPWVYGATFCYRRDFWRAHPFADMNIGEDACFAAGVPLDLLHALPNNRLFVALVHAANTSPKLVRDSQCRPFEVDAVRALTGTGWPSAANRGPGEAGVLSGPRS